MDKARAIMKFIVANETHINIDQILWVECRIAPDDSQMVVTVQFTDRKLTWSGAMAKEFMGKWHDFIASLAE